MKSLSCIFLLYSISGAQLEMPTFESVQLTKDEAMKNCDNNGRKADAIIFIRTLRYVNVLKDFINHLKKQILDLSHKLQDLSNDINFRNLRITSIQDGIKGTLNLIDTLKNNIGITIDPLKKIAEGLTELDSLPGDKKLSSGETFLGITQAQKEQLNQIIEATVNGQNMVKSSLLQLQANPATSRIIESKLRRQKNQLDSNKKAFEETKDMINKFDNEILKRQIDQLNEYVLNIKENKMAISYHQKILDDDQKKIAALNDELQNIYLPLLTKTKNTIEEKAGWLQKKTSDEGLFSSCPYFISALL